MVQKKNKVFTFKYWIKFSVNQKLVITKRYVDLQSRFKATMCHNNLGLLSLIRTSNIQTHFFFSF